MYGVIMRIARSTRRHGARSARPAHRRKNLILDQRLIDRARLLLDAPTETEAITRALAVAIDLATFRRDLGTAARTMYGKGRFAHLDGARGLDFSGFVPPAARPASRRR